MIKFSVLTAITILYSLFTSDSFKDDLGDSVKRGEEVYSTNCMSCHMINGEGLPGIYPPLVNVDSLLLDVSNNINVILKGQKGEFSINGEVYNTDMPSQEFLTDEQVADVLNYVRNTWGNTGEIILPANVKTKRGSN